VERGVLTPEQAVNHPHGNLVTRAVGAADRLFLDVEIFPIQTGDLFILCSDGLEKEVAEEEMSVLVEASDPSQLSHTLLARALAVGAHDNVTVISVAIHGQPGSPKGSDEAGGSDETDVEDDADTERHEQRPPT
jgi:serine/threonine protein phosphatase PrpC